MTSQPFSRPALPSLRICGLDIVATSLVAAAEAMADYCCDERRKSAPPLYVTSVNGHVLSLCARDQAAQRLFAEADTIHCDGQPLVLLSRLIGGIALPERVATTDLFPLMAARAAHLGLSFYLLGGSPAVNQRLCETLRREHPRLILAGASHGYLPREDEPRVVAEIAALKPDILWVAMGVPLEQSFVVRNRAALDGVGIIKTSGGLFDFMSGTVLRAPGWMQALGLEWLFRLMQEPRRLFWRYAISNPHALYLMVRDLIAGRLAASSRPRG